MKHKQRNQVEKEPEIYKEKSMESQESEKSLSDQAVGKSYNFDTVNSADSLHESKSSLKSNSESNSGEMNLFKCRICDGSFTSKQYLNSHIEIVHGVENIFVCSICGHFFSLKVDLLSGAN